MYRKLNNNSGPEMNGQFAPLTKHAFNGGAVARKTCSLLLLDSHVVKMSDVQVQLRHPLFLLNLLARLRPANQTATLGAVSL